MFCPSENGHLQWKTDLVPFHLHTTVYRKLKSFTFEKVSNLTSRIFKTTLVSLIIVQQILLIFWKIPSCTALFHPARLLILGNFKPKPLFLLIKNEKLRPARHYFILHDHWFLEFWQPVHLFHPARLLDRLEWWPNSSKIKNIII